MSNKIAKDAVFALEFGEERRGFLEVLFAMDVYRDGIDDTDEKKDYHHCQRVCSRVEHG